MDEVQGVQRALGAVVALSRGHGLAVPAWIYPFPIYPIPTPPTAPFPTPGISQARLDWKVLLDPWGRRRRRKRKGRLWLARCHLLTHSLSGAVVLGFFSPCTSSLNG